MAQLDEDLVELLESCLLIESTLDEFTFLTDLVATIRDTALFSPEHRLPPRTRNANSISSNDVFCNDIEEEEEDVTEEGFLKTAARINPGPQICLEDMEEHALEAGLTWKVAEKLDWLIFYLFHRRYGWPDLKEEGAWLIVSRPEAEGKERKSGKVEELRYKASLVELLDQLILWIFHQPVSFTTVRMLSSALRLSASSPVTRLQLAIHSMDWLKETFIQTDEDILFESIKDLVFLCITDCWSQIRSAAVSRLGPIAERLDQSQIQIVFEELCKMCDPVNNTWQMSDGSICAINAIIKRFHKVGYNIGDFSLNSSSISPRVHSQIRMGNHLLDRLPYYMTQRMKSLVFQLISTPQLTIREGAVKAFVSYLNRCNDQESELAFHDVYQRLQYKPPRSASVTNDTFTLLESVCPVLLNGFVFMNPYPAESLLNLCLHLLKQMRDHQSYLENWDLYHRTFDIYLMHPASSVRLATSNIYKYAVASSISNPLLVKNIICCLMRKWLPHQATLLLPVGDLTIRSEDSRRRRPSVTDPQGTFVEEWSTWEWREGRLLVYELLCQLLIKNHHLYTFGPPTLCVKTSNNSLPANHNSRSRAASISTNHMTSSNRHLPISDRLANRTEEGNDSGIEIAGSASSKTSSRSTGCRGLIASRNQLSSNLSTTSNQTSDTALNLGETKMASRRRSQDTRLVQREFFRQRLPTLDGDCHIESAHSHNSLYQYNSLLQPANLHGNTQQQTSRKMNSRPASNTSTGTSCSSFLVHVKMVEAAEEESRKRAQSNDCSLPSFRTLLCQMLHTCSESIADSQWELRRIAKQTFPCLGELLRWFDPCLLSDLITTHLVYKPTLMTFSCLCLLKDTLQHAARLKVMVENPPPAWQGEVALTAVSRIREAVQTNLPLWLRSCHHYLQRSQMDCITPITAHILILSLVAFTESTKEQASHVECIINVFLRLDAILQSKDETIPILGFEIYPSLTMVPSVGCSPLEFISHFITEIQSLLPRLILTSDLPACLHLLPVLIRWTSCVASLRTDTSETIRGLVSAVTTLAGRLVEEVTRDRRIIIRVDTEVQKTVAVMAELLSDKGFFQTVWMRQFIDVIVNLLEVLSFDLQPLVNAVVTSIRPRISRNKPLSAGNSNKFVTEPEIVTNQSAICTTYEDEEDDGEIAECPNSRPTSAMNGSKEGEHEEDDLVAGDLVDSRRSRWLKGKRGAGNHLHLFASQAHQDSLDGSGSSDRDSDDEDTMPSVYPESLALGSSSLPPSTSPAVSQHPISNINSPRSTTHDPDLPNDLDAAPSTQGPSRTLQKPLESRASGSDWDSGSEIDDISVMSSDMDGFVGGREDPGLQVAVKFLTRMADVRIDLFRDAQQSLSDDDLQYLNSLLPGLEE